MIYASQSTTVYMVFKKDGSIVRMIKPPVKKEDIKTYCSPLVINGRANKKSK